VSSPAGSSKFSYNCVHTYSGKGRGRVHADVDLRSFPCVFAVRLAYAVQLSPDPL